MHLLLTDRLTCPRCGPAFGLILLADRLQDRRVHEGRLGCPNCRDAYPIVDGFADLRAPPRGELPAGLAGASPGPADADEALRLAALLGIERGPGTVALVGQPARHAAALVSRIDDLHAVALDAHLAGWPDAPGVSRAVSRPGLPFFSDALRGVVADGRLGVDSIAEAARVVGRGSRVVVTRAAERTARRLQECGLTILADEDETVVAARG